jgi:hypothetical protein
MSSCYQRLRPLLRIILALLTAGFPLLALAVATMDLVTTIRAYLSDLYYVDHNYLADAIWWGLIGLSGLLPAGRVVFRHNARLHWLWFPICVSVFMIYYPNAVTYGGTGLSQVPHAIAARTVHHQLSFVYSKMKQAVESGQPTSCVSGPTASLSPYSKAGTRLSYQRICLMTDESLDSLLAASAPGTLFIITRPGDASVKLMATALNWNISPTATWLRARGGERIEFTLPSLKSP